MLTIRHTVPGDLPTVMSIYARARAFMTEMGNPTQWGPTCWPPENLIRQDIAREKSYVCTENDRVVGVFFFDQGQDVEPTYARIEDGAWRDPSPYGVVHRIASDGTVRGTGAFCIDWAWRQSGGHLRIDTHGDNQIMQSLLAKLGFVHCGTIYVQEDDAPRLAYEKSALAILP